MRNASFVALVAAVALAASGCSGLLPKAPNAEQSSSGEITGTVAGTTPWDQVDSIVKIVNNSRTPQEKDMFQISGVGVPMNVQTSNRGLTLFVAYFVHVLNVPGSAPAAYDNAAAQNKDLASYRRVILGLFKLSFMNIPGVDRVNITFFWPDGVVTAFSAPQADWQEFAAGKVPVAEFLTEHSMRLPLGQLVSILALLDQSGIDADKFLNFALQLFIQLEQKPQQPQQPVPPKPKKP